MSDKEIKALQKAVRQLRHAEQGGAEAVALTGEEVAALVQYLDALQDAARELETVKQYAALMQTAGTRVQQCVALLDEYLKTA